MGLQVAQEGGDKVGPFRRKEGRAGETRLGAKSAALRPVPEGTAGKGRSQACAVQRAEGPPPQTRLGGQGASKAGQGAAGSEVSWQWPG